MTAVLGLSWAGLLGAGCDDAIAVPIRLAALQTDAGVVAPEPGLDAGPAEVPVAGGPAEAPCAIAEDWPEAWAQSEARLIEEINRRRQGGMRCRNGWFQGLRPLRPVFALRCAARLHSRDMVLRGFQAHTNPDGEDPAQRMRAAGFDVRGWSESFVAGEADPVRVFFALLSDLDDCGNLVTREFDHIGVGRYEDVWTLDFASH